MKNGAVIKDPVQAITRSLRWNQEAFYVKKCQKRFSKVDPVRCFSAIEGEKFNI